MTLEEKEKKGLSRNTLVMYIDGMPVDLVKAEKESDYNKYFMYYLSVITKIAYVDKRDKKIIKNSYGFRDIPFRILNINGRNSHVSFVPLYSILRADQMYLLFEDNLTPEQETEICNYVFNELTVCTSGRHRRLTRDASTEDIY